MKVGALCQRPPTAIDAEAPISHAAQLMADEGVGSLVVLRGGTICGILTDRDIVTRGVCGPREVRDLPVSALMTRDPVVIGPDDTVASATVLMAQKQVRRIPIVADGVLVGLVSLDDALALVSDELANLRSAIAAAVTP